MMKSEESEVSKTLYKALTNDECNEVLKSSSGSLFQTIKRIV